MVRTFSISRLSPNRKKPENFPRIPISIPVNWDFNFRFSTASTPESLKASGLIRKLSIDVKVLGECKLTKKLSVSAHGFSKSAIEKIESAGGTVIWLRGEPVKKKRKRHKAAVPAPEEPEVAASEVEEEPADEPTSEAAGE